MIAKIKGRETQKFLRPFLFVAMLLGLLLYRRFPFGGEFLNFYKKYGSCAFYFYKTMENKKSL